MNHSSQFRMHVHIRPLAKCKHYIIKYCFYGYSSLLIATVSLISPWTFKFPVKLMPLLQCKQCSLRTLKSVFVFENENIWALKNTPVSYTVPLVDLFPHFLHIYHPSIRRHSLAKLAAKNSFFSNK